MSNAILCPSCRKLISKDETECPHCGHRIAVGRTAQPLIQVFANPESTIQIFTGFTVLMYIGSLLLDTKSALSMSQGILGFGSPRKKLPSFQVGEQTRVFSFCRDLCSVSCSMSVSARSKRCVRIPSQSLRIMVLKKSSLISTTAFQNSTGDLP